MACRPLSRSIAVSQGKGTTREEAKVSAFMKAAETYHAERTTLPLRLASAAELASDCALVDVEGLPRSRLGHFDPLQPILWIEGQDLMSGRPLWQPFEMGSASNLTATDVTGRADLSRRADLSALANLLARADLSMRGRLR